MHLVREAKEGVRSFVSPLPGLRLVKCSSWAGEGLNRLHVGPARGRPAHLSLWPSSNHFCRSCWGLKLRSSSPTQPTEKGRCLVLLPRISSFTAEYPWNDIDLGISADGCGDVLLLARTRDCRYAAQRVCGLEVVSVAAGGFCSLIDLSFKASSESMFMNGLSSSGWQAWCRSSSETNIQKRPSYRCKQWSTKTSQLLWKTKSKESILWSCMVSSRANNFHGLLQVLNKFLSSLSDCSCYRLL